MRSFLSLIKKLGFVSGLVGLFAVSEARADRSITFVLAPVTQSWLPSPANANRWYLYCNFTNVSSTPISQTITVTQLAPQSIPPCSPIPPSSAPVQCPSVPGASKAPVFSVVLQQHQAYFYEPGLNPPVTDAVPRTFLIHVKEDLGAVVGSCEFDNGIQLNPPISNNSYGVGSSAIEINGGRPF